MNGNFVATSGEQIAAFFSETHGVVCSAYVVENVSTCHENIDITTWSDSSRRIVAGPATAEIVIKGVNPRITTLEDLGVERPASELSVDELMKIVYQKLEQRQTTRHHHQLG